MPMPFNSEVSHGREQKVETRTEQYRNGVVSSCSVPSHLPNLYGKEGILE
jgi:hypothetical protein